MFSSNIDNMLNAFFGGGIPEMGIHESGRRFMEKLNQHQTVSVSLDDLYNGCEVELNSTRRVICVNCSGRGTRKKNKSMLRCTRCGGTGTSIEVQQMGMMIQQMQTTCNACNGTGTRIDPSACCQSCYGEKVVEIEVPIQVEIEPGMRHEESIFYPKMGNEYPGYASAGDLTVEVSQRSHPLFVRSENDLHMKHVISLAEALCGLRFKIVQLDGRELLVTRKRGEITYPGEQKCLRGEGMPIRSTGKFGDLHIEFIVNYPEYVDDNQIRLLSAALPEPRQHPMHEVPNDESKNEEVCYASREDIETLKKEISLDEMSDEDDEQGGTVGCQAQ
ncbi:unnamed protein product [Phytomonas sp. Hart1]|nr:unnamed protein product [Phytomonas sp. Hart1]|eukprot:CCW66286.1 unnamed protein product [Phytomonas sp. isolate Hart1]